MSRTLTNPNAGNTFRGKLPVYSGGSNQDTAPLALSAFNGVPSAEYNQNNGVAGLDNTGHLPYSLMPAGVSASIGLSGPELLYLSQQGVWTINNYDSQVAYSVTCTSGFVSRSGDKIYYTAPATVGTHGFTINNKVIPVVVDDRYIAKPVITSPVAEMTNVGSGVVVTSSQMSVTGGFPETILTASDKAANDAFSYSVALTPDGTRLVLGSHGKDVSSFTDAGAVYVFSWSGTAWVQEQKLTASVTQTNAYFGVSVAITPDGTRIAIGSHGYDAAFSDMGAVYIFSRSGTTWTQEQLLTAGTPNASAVFGYCVAITTNGDRVIIGSYGATPGGLIQAGSAYIFSRSGTVWTQEALLTASDKAANDAFGSSVAISSTGDRVAISANNADISSLVDCGAVYVFSRAVTTWTQEAKIAASDKAAFNYFGYSIDMSADSTTLVVGAYTATVGSIATAGVAYVYTRSGATWTENQKLVASDKATNDYFGVSVALSSDGSKIAIGSHKKDSDNVVDCGGVYLFNKINGTWIEDVIVTTSNKALQDTSFFKVALTTNGTKLIGNSYQNDPSGITAAGAAYVYDVTYHASTDWQLSTDAGFTTIIQESLTDTINRRSWIVGDLALNTDYYIRCRYNGSQYGTSEWSEMTHVKTRQSWLPINEQAIVTASDKAASDSYSQAISLSADGSRMAIGAYLRNSASLADSGAVYVYKRSGSSWVEEQILTASDKAAGDQFGVSVVLSSDGSRLAVGAAQKTVGGLTQAGQAYVYSRSGTTWSQEQILVASDKATGDLYGTCVTFDAAMNRLAVGAAFKTVSAQSASGQVYVYTRSGTVWTEEQKISPTDRVPGDHFGVSVAFDTNAIRLLIGANGVDNGATGDVGGGYVFSRSGTVWSQEAKLIASDIVANQRIGWSLAMTLAGDRVVLGSITTGVAAAIYVFSRSGTTWTQEARLVASGEVVGDAFGTDIKISSDGSKIAVSAYGASTNGLTNNGTAYLFVRTGAAWTQEAVLTASDKVTGDNLGISLTCTPDFKLLAIGANSRDSNGIVNSGAVYIFQ